MLVEDRLMMMMMMMMILLFPFIKNNSSWWLNQPIWKILTVSSHKKYLKPPRNLLQKHAEEKESEALSEADAGYLEFIWTRLSVAGISLEGVPYPPWRFDGVPQFSRPVLTSLFIQSFCQLLIYRPGFSSIQRLFNVSFLVFHNPHPRQLTWLLKPEHDRFQVQNLLFQGSILQVPFKKTIESMYPTVTYLHLNIYIPQRNQRNEWYKYGQCSILFMPLMFFCCFLMFFIRSSLSGLQGPRRHCPCRHACHLLWTEVERASWFFNCGQITIFHQPRFPWNNWIALTIRYLLGVLGRVRSRWNLTRTYVVGRPVSLGKISIESIWSLGKSTTKTMNLWFFEGFFCKRQSTNTKPQNKLGQIIWHQQSYPSPRQLQIALGNRLACFNFRRSESCARRRSVRCWVVGRLFLGWCRRFGRKGIARKSWTLEKTSHEKHENDFRWSCYWETTNIY